MNKLNFKNAEDFAEKVSCFSYRITTLEQLRDLNLSEKLSGEEYTQEEMNKKEVSMEYRKCHDGRWQENYEEVIGNISDGFDVGYHSSEDAFRIFNEVSELIDHIEYEE